MTPERIEEIKEDAAHEISEGYGHDISDITYEEVLELLAALEESQQKVKVAKTAIESFGRITDDMEEEYEELQKKYAESQQQKVELWECEDCGFSFNAIHEDDTPEGGYSCPLCAESRLAKELAEAQQTIARQREVLDFYANQEHWELPSFGRGQSMVTSDRGSKARELLEEGTAMPVTSNCPTCGNQHPINHPSRPGIYLCVPCDYVYEEGSDKA